ncbi:hypothetical protein VTL71DRAFT_8197 [Oculimacula yallundae]|uniref:Uncharacterized protein n=1 Tax=Oculimacula yallundae TaxID=86028 RepID=A0ABR4CZB5_9HELO
MGMPHLAHTYWPSLMYKSTDFRNMGLSRVSKEPRHTAEIDTCSEPGSRISRKRPPKGLRHSQRNFERNSLQ